MPGNRPVRFGPGAVGKGPARHGQAPRQRPTGTGQNPTLRAWCEQSDHQLGYVFGIPRSFMVRLGCGTTMRADQAVGLVDADGWNYRSAGPGSKGERDYAWAWIATASPQHHLLVRRNLTNPSDLAYFYCYSPPGRPPATLATLVRVAGMRWPVEEDLCATRRLAVSPTQLGGTRREVPGSDDLPGAERLRGQEHVRKPAAVSRRRSGALGDPRDMAKAGLPEPQSPGDANFSSAGKTPETGAKPCVDVGSLVGATFGAWSDAQRGYLRR
jgi:hypothetical protein